ncbi:MAG TPA: hypothetical protein VJA47_02260 [archaeon]|nr:hypothetical protein [archaeon]
MFDTKPLERSMEFRDRLRRKDPKIADRYENYLSLKSSWHTSEDGFYQSVLEEAVDYIGERVDEAIGELIPKQMRMVYQAVVHHAAAVWAKQRREYKKHGGEMPPESPLGSVGIRTLVDFADKVVRNVRWHSAVPWDEDGLDLEGELDLRSGSLEFYIKHFRRLEREKMTGTTASEKVFLPYLRHIYKSCLQWLFNDLYFDLSPLPEYEGVGDLNVPDEEREPITPLNTITEITGTNVTIGIFDSVEGQDADPTKELRETWNYIKRKCWEGEYLEKEFRKLEDNKSADEINEDFIGFRFAKEMVSLLIRYRSEWEGAEGALRKAHLIGEEELKRVYGEVMKSFAKKPGFYSKWF